MLSPLPIDPVLPEIVARLRERGVLVLEAPPGAGKTTRVPRALLDAGFAERGEIWVLEPRRIAALLAARRVAEELGEAPGGTVGHEMRFERAVGPETRVRFVTEGILTRRLVADPRLSGVTAIVLDEFHERHLQTDVALALLAKLRAGERRDLALAVMSATLDAGPVARHLDAPVVSSPGRAFDVAIEHLPRADDRPLEIQVASALRRLVDEGLDGHVLVFLPGAREIRRAHAACEAIARRADLLLVELHGSLSPSEQALALSPSARNKVILSTNVAETSVTIDGVAAVIDSGLARIAEHATWSGLPMLRVAPVSRASAAQRAGRAGRTRPGRCLRLYTRGDHDARPEHTPPEIARADLAETLLDLRALGIDDPAVLPWLDPPPSPAIDAAVRLLERLGACDQGRLTPLGRAMADLPLHPRLSRVAVEASRRGHAADGALLVAMLADRDPPRASSCDVLDALARAESSDASRRLQRVADRILRALSQRAPALPPAPHDDDRERALRLALLSGFSDRLGRLRRPKTSTGRTGLELVLAVGRTASLPEGASLGADLALALDAEERLEAGVRKIVLRLGSPVDADWLLESFFDRIEETAVHEVGAGSGRVDVVRRLSFDGLLLEESRSPAAPSPEVSHALAAAVRASGWRKIVDPAPVERWLARVAFLRRHRPELDLPVADEALVDALLERLCEGKTSLSELEGADLDAALRASLSPGQTRALAELAPEWATIGARRVRIDYSGEAPSIASRLQDFFGMATGPTVMGGRVPVVLSLLAPNQRPVQVTTDLGGFWDRHYPTIARELRRRYPKHAWPDDPRSARPPAPRR